MLAVRFLNEEQQIELLTLNLNGMTASELRIGNKILFSEEGTEFEVNAIDQEGVNVKCATTTTWIELEYFEGIKVTNEWLIKLGFIKIKTIVYPLNMAYWCKSDSKNNTIFIETGSRGFVLRGNDFVLYEYVHQLQNLYFALTGEELQYTQAGGV